MKSISSSAAEVLQLSLSSYRMKSQLYPGARVSIRPAHIAILTVLLITLFWCKVYTHFDVIAIHPTPSTLSTQDYWSVPYEGIGIRQRLQAFMPYDPNRRWNRNIIQSWRTQLDDDVHDNIHDAFRTWTTQNPDFNHTLFLDSTEMEYLDQLNLYENNLGDVHRTYFDLFDMRILKSDLFRYFVIWMEGGIWADIDTFTLKPFDYWITGSGYNDTPSEVSVEQLEREIGMVVGIESGRVNEYGVPQYLFSAKPGHPVLREVIARIVENAGEISMLVKLDRLREGDVITYTGPTLMTKVVQEWVKNRYDATFHVRNDFRDVKVPTRFGDILVLPWEAFSLRNSEMENPKHYAGHFVQGSWRFEKAKNNVSKSN